VAAALAVQEEKAPRQVELRALQSELQRQGAHLRIGSTASL
jgi:hypothetical protein